MRSVPCRAELPLSEAVRLVHQLRVVPLLRHPLPGLQLRLGHAGFFHDVRSAALEGPESSEQWQRRAPVTNGKQNGSKHIPREATKQF